MFPASPFFTIVDSAASVVSSAWVQLMFWLFPLLLLKVCWGSLAGRRGPVRAAQIWLCFCVGLVAHALVNYWLDQSATLIPLLQAACLLVVLVAGGLAFDFATTRKFRTDVTVLSLFQGYLRLNRLAATLTLLIPLITAGLTIWTQIENGAPAQSPTPATSPKAPTGSQGH